MMLNGIRSERHTLPNMTGILKKQLIGSLEDIDSDDSKIEINYPEIPICLANEVLLFEHLFLNKAALKHDQSKFWINRRITPLSYDRIHRHITLGSGSDFYKLRKVTRVHVVFLSNLKLRVIDQNDKVIFGDAFEDH